MTAVRRAGFWAALIAVVGLVTMGRYWAAFLLFAVVAVPIAMTRLARYQKSLDLDPPDPGTRYGANHYRP